MTNEPSPRPWRCECGPTVNAVVAANGAVVVPHTGYAANAALIVDAVNERDRLRNIVRRLTEYADAVTAYSPPAIEVVSSEHPTWAFDGAELLREARAAIGEETK